MIAMTELSPSEKQALRKNTGVQFGTDRLLAAPGEGKGPKGVLIVVAVVLLVLGVGTAIALSAAQ